MIKFVVQQLTTSGWEDIPDDYRTKEDAIIATDSIKTKTRIIKATSKIVWQSKDRKPLQN